MIKALLAFLLAGTLMVPPLAPVLGNESAQTLGKERQGQPHPETRQALATSPVPYVNMMPWMLSGSTLESPKVDLLWGLKSEDVAAFIGQPIVPSAWLSLNLVSGVQTRVWPN